MPELSIVVPVYNEVECLEELWAELRDVLDATGRSYEVILVNDGSTDGSEAVSYTHLTLPTILLV